MKSGFIAIVGRPNAGKSTLLNRVLETRLSVVTPKAQTTRERVLGILSTDQGQVVFIDTPGIHRAKEGGINAYMVAEARDALDEPNVVWYLVDPSSKPEFEQPVIELLKGAKAPVIILHNKCDLIDRVVPEARFAELEQGVAAAVRAAGIEVHSVRRVSADKGEGIPELLADTWKLLPEGPLYYPDTEQVSDRPVRFFVGEMIREQLLLCLGEELPYSCAVQIEKYDEGTKPPRIEAVIHVERDSQKGMVIGKGGVKIKEIGQKSRRNIEGFIGGQVFLGLKVKVTRDWTRDPEALRRLGYDLPKELRGGRGASGRRSGGAPGSSRRPTAGPSRRGGA